MIISNSCDKNIRIKKKKKHEIYNGNVIMHLFNHECDNRLKLDNTKFC